MDNLLKILKLIYLIIWIPLGILLMAVIIFMIVANPLREMMGSLGPGGGFPQAQGNPGGPSGADSQQFPTEEQIRQFMEQSPGGPGSFGPPQE